MLSHYLYISTAPSLSRADVSAIIEISVRNNAASDVTGLLVYNGRNFLQLLEGDDTKLVGLLGQIALDPRHTGFSILERKIIEQRACPDWAMQWIVLADDVNKRKEALQASLPAGLDAETRKIITNFAVLN